jgi:alpha-ketoglutarate-dependent taurine dioxygenase
VDAQIDDLRAKGIDPYLMYPGNVDPHTGERREVNEKFFGEWEWHSDMSYMPAPPTFSLLHSRRVPTEGGDTGFCSQVLAARTLPTELRAKVEGRGIKHDSTYSSNGIIRPGGPLPWSPHKWVRQRSHSR